MRPEDTQYEAVPGEEFGTWEVQRVTRVVLATAEDHTVALEIAQALNEKEGR